MSDIVTRKDEHLNIVLNGAAAGAPGATGFDAVRFEHVALPELHMDEVDLSTTFLGHRLEAPLIISSMTGGVARAAQINANLAEAAQVLNIAFAVGSQRVAIENGEAAGFDRSLRDKAGAAPLLAQPPTVATARTKSPSASCLSRMGFPVITSTAVAKAQLPLSPFL